MTIFANDAFARLSLCFSNNILLFKRFDQLWKGMKWGNLTKDLVLENPGKQKQRVIFKGKPYACNVKRLSQCVCLTGGMGYFTHSCNLQIRHLLWNNSILHLPWWKRIRIILGPLPYMSHINKIMISDKNYFNKVRVRYLKIDLSNLFMLSIKTANTPKLWTYKIYLNLSLLFLVISKDFKLIKHLV